MAEPTKMEKLFLHAARMLNSTLDYEDLMKLVLELTTDAVDAEAALVYRIDKDVPNVRARYMDQDSKQVKYFKIPKGEGLIGWVAASKEPIIVNDVTQDSRFYWPIKEILSQVFRSVLIVPLTGRGRVIGVVEAINKRNGVFSDHDLDTLVGLANQFAVAIDNANLYREARREAMKRQLLYQVGTKLATTLNIDEVLKLILESLKKVIDFNAGGVYLLNEKSHDLSSVSAVGYGQGDEKFVHLKFGQGLVGWSAKTGEAVIIDDVTGDKRYVNARPETKSEIVCPMKIDGRVIGVMNLESDKSDAFDKESLDLLTAFASQAAISVERALLHSKMMENRRVTEQLAIARQIQLTFIPKSDPVIDGYDISGVNIPSGEVGGDYFDFITIVNNQTGISIADVSGKGIPAALIMASFRASLIAEIRNNYAIRTICSKVNRLLYESVEQGNYVTAFYGVLDSKNDIFTFANCGHNRPIFLKKNGNVVFLAEGGPALGVLEDSLYEERPIFIQSGDLVFFYTDGVSEAVGKEGQEFGQDRIISALRQYRDLPSHEIHRRLYDDILEFASPTHYFDDLTMVVLKKL